MKKLSILALMTAVGVAGSTALPTQAANVSSISCEQLNGKAYIIANGQECSAEELQKLLAELCDNLPGNPEINLPNTEIPDVNIPDSNFPEIPEVPEIPDNESLSYAEQVVSLVNAERAKAGLNALTLDTEIASAALVRARETEKSFSHTRPDGRAFNTVLTDNGIKFNGAGENIAWGQRSPEEVMNGWMNSEGHRANILNPRFTKIGVGHYQNAAGRNYWTQLFTY